MLEWYTLEATLIDIFFYATLGLKVGIYVQSPTFWIDRVVSLFILSWAIFRLMRMLFKIRDLDRLKTVAHLFDFEKEVITEGMHWDSYNFVPKTQVNFSLYLNLMFKIKIAILTVLIVSLQTSPRVCLCFMLTTQFCSFCYFIFT